MCDSSEANRKRSDEPAQRPVPGDFPDTRLLSADDPFVRAVEGGLAASLVHAGLLSHTNRSGGHSFRRLRIMVAFSGGPDSTALLAALMALRDRMSLDLVAAHVNHHSRGGESEADQYFCEQLCRFWQLRLEVEHVQQEPPEATGGAGTASPARPAESVLREARHRLLKDAAGRSSAPYIAFAHTADDQIETMLFRLFRGTGLAGLMGMEPSRRLSPGISIVRPLLAARRSDCHDYLERVGITPRYDTSNLDVEYARNYIRHRIVPVIEARFPGFQRRLENLRQRIAAEETMLAGMTAEALQRAHLAGGADENFWGVEMFLAEPEAIQRRMIAAALQQRGVEVHFDRVTAVLDTVHRAGSAGSARISLNSRWDAAVRNGLLVWLDKESPGESGSAGDLDVTLKVPGLTIVPSLGRALRIEIFRPDEEGEAQRRFPPADAWEALVDLSRAGFPLVLRGRRPGDIIRPFGMEQPVRLKKFLHTRKAAHRHPGAPPIVVADQEEVLWVPGVGLSNKVRVAATPTHRLAWVPLARDEVRFA